MSMITTELLCLLFQGFFDLITIQWMNEVEIVWMWVAIIVMSFDTI